MRKISLVAFLLTLSTPALAAEVATNTATPLPAPTSVPTLASYAVVKEKSFLKFIAIMNNAPIEGKFTKYDADIRFHRDNLAESSIDVDVDTTSVEVANDDVKNNITLPEWLGTATFPKAHLACKKLSRMQKSENYYADCTFTLRDKTMPVVLNFQMTNPDDTIAIANGYVTLRRSDFNVGQGEWSHDDVVKNGVRVEFRVYAQKK